MALSSTVGVVDSIMGVGVQQQRVLFVSLVASFRGPAFISEEFSVLPNAGSKAARTYDLKKVFFFANSKCKRYFHNRLKPSKLTWIAMYRKQHKKDIAQEVVKKRRRATKKPYSRSIVGATLEVIQKKRSPKVRDAALWFSRVT
ncbi:hypothetical protein FNV43_RR16976 [Rhamnella rubrinervis]|uniref:Large ribosomal subunit protein eL24-related N-terminal domain-containing protein n=1 Tax=Rhamnella rubrinervis TaxID=2594499 RepID=A0A8K0GZV2_9ROSA|nr:hypothetical protein FNV43_RR16976 [Rhamnella rubrinervis]